MTTRKLDKSEWHGYFDRLSRRLGPSRIEIEVGSLALGEQVAAEWLPLGGITYDPKNDLLELVMETVDHLIRAPREIYVEETVAGLAAIEVLDGGDTKQIIRFKPPVLLPPSAQ